MPSSALHRRLARLETERRAARRSGGCPECGNGGPGPVVFNIPRPRVFGEPPDPDDDPSKDVCSTCGFRRVLRIPSPRLMGREDGPLGPAR